MVKFHHLGFNLYLVRTAGWDTRLLTSQSKGLKYRWMANLYLSLMKCLKADMSPSVGRLKSLAILPSQKRLAFRLPMLWTKLTCSGSHVSKVVDLTLETSTPNERCTPLQFRQTKTPRFTDAHVGPLARQSAHLHVFLTLKLLATARCRQPRPYNVISAHILFPADEQ